MGVYAMAAMVSSQNYGYDRPNYAPPLSDRKPLNKKQKQLLKEERLIKSGLKKFHYGDNYIIALNQTVADKKAMKKGYI